LYRSSNEEAGLEVGAEELTVLEDPDPTLVEEASVKNS
jgi:hypothetical protein